MFLMILDSRKLYKEVTNKGHYCAENCAGSPRKNTWTDAQAYLKTRK